MGLRMLVTPALYPLFSEAIDGWSRDIVCLSADTGNHIQQALQHGAADVGVFAWDEETSRLLPHEELFHSPLVLCLPDPKDSHLSENAGPAEILSHGVLFISHDTCLHNRQVQVLKAHGIVHPHILATADESLLIELTAAGHGPGILPLSYMAGMAPHRAYPLPDTAPVPFHIVTAPGLHSEPLAEFLRYLHQFVDDHTEASDI